MAKKKTVETPAPGTKDNPTFAKEVIPISATEYNNTYGRTAAIYYAQERALASVESGLKPGQRRLIYAAYMSGLSPQSKRKKSSALVANTSGTYHPHGDAGIYDTLVTLTRPFSRLRLFDSDSNFGANPGDVPAASRYTEVRLSEAGWEMVRDLKSDGVVPMMPNYDGTTTEPITLPVRFPAALVAGSSGIATGFRADIPAHNIQELVKVCKALLDNEDLTTDEMMKIMPGPDWGTAAMVIGDDSQIRQYYETGEGLLQVRSKIVALAPPNQKDVVVLKELVPGLGLSTQIHKIRDLILKKGGLKGIRGVENHSDKDNGMEVTFYLRRGVSQEEAIEQILSETQLEGTYKVLMYMLDRRRRPKLWSMKDALLEFLSMRDDVVYRRAESDLKKTKEKLFKSEAIEQVALHKEKAVKVIMDAEDNEEAAQALTFHLTIVPEQAEYILTLPLRRLTKADVISIQQEVKDLRSKISDLEETLSSEDKRKSIIQDELDEQLKIFSGPEHDRRTVLAHDIQPIVRKSVELSDDEKLALWKLDTMSGVLSDSGDKISKGEVVWAVYSDGRVKLFSGKGLPNKVTEKTISPDISNLVACGTLVPGKKRLCLVSTEGKVLMLDTSEDSTLNPQGIAGNGVAGMKLPSDVAVIAGFAVEDSDVVVTMSEDGWKAVSSEDVPTKGRGSQGVRVHTLRKGETTITQAFAGSNLTSGGESVTVSTRAQATNKGTIVLD